MARKRTTRRRAPARRNATRRRSSVSPQVKNGAAAVAGGALGSLLGGLLVRSGINPRTATIGMVGLGAVGALTTTGTTRYASFGVAAAGAGQLSLSLLADQQAKASERNALPVERNNRLLDAYEDARRAMTEDEEEDEIEFEMAA